MSQVDFSSFLALLCDVDQTVTSTKNQVSLATKDAFAALVAKGNMVAAACTGRGYPMLLKENLLELFTPDTPHICCGGGLVITADGTPLWHQGLSPETVTAAVDVAEASGSSLIIKTATKMFANARAVELYSQFTDRYAGMFQTLVKDGEWQNEPAISMAVAQPSQEMETFLSTQEVMIKRNASYYGHILLDVTAVGVTKISGLKAWSDITGIPLKNCIGVGDGTNDLEFLSEVGYAVAMGNAVPELKDLADQVTDHTDQNGLATFISNNLL